MRILMILMLSFSAGTLASLPNRSGGLPYYLSGLCLVLGLLFLIFLRKRELRLVLIFFGLGTGLIWGAFYQDSIVHPNLDYAGETITISAEALSYSHETSYGISVETRLTPEFGDARATLWFESNREIKPGDRITGEFAMVRSDHSGSYYSFSEGIYLYGYGRGEITIMPTESNSLRYLPQRIAHRLETSIVSSVPLDAQGLAVALTTGNRTLLSESVKSDLKASGIYHALALSGMHLAVLLSILNYLVLKRKFLKALLGIPLAIVFTVITGCCHSMVRAAIMQCLILSAYLFRREKDMPTALALALGLMMAENPWSIANWGLQLSFASVIGIELFGEKLQKFFMGKSKPTGKLSFRLKRLFAASLSSTFSAMVMTMPLMVIYFGMISLVSPITNLLTGTVVSFCFGGSLLTALVGLVFPSVGALLGQILAWGFRYVSWVSLLLARFPLGQLYTRSVYGILAVIVIYAAIFFLIRRRKKVIPVCACLSFLALVMLFGMVEGVPPSITAIDAGQGQCIILSCGGGTAMIDCGGNKGNPANSALEYLRQTGQADLDLLVLTHYDEDHIGDVPQLFEHVSIGKIALPDTGDPEQAEIMELARNHDTEVYLIRQDTQVYFGGSSLQIFAPLMTGDKNESGLSVLARLEDMNVLITGDMQSLTELRLVKTKALPVVQVLVAGHHGSEDSTSTLLLEEVLPQKVIISVGQNNYGHPSEETLKRITAAGAQILRTDQTGTITIKGE